MLMTVVRFAALFSIVLYSASDAHANALQLDTNTTFRGREKFDQLVARADEWKGLPIGQRVAAVGRAMAGTAYKNFTLEIDDHVETPSVNLNALDCWTFFESALAFARMLDEPADQWTPATMLRKIELDRYRGGRCDGTYLSRLHYLEEWFSDNAGRGLIKDLTRDLGAVRVPHVTGEMTIHWKGYRYIRANPGLLPDVRRMEERVRELPLYHVPKSKVAAIESNLRDGDIIGITTKDPGGVGTTHVGLAYRTSDGVLHFMHASAPRNYGKVVVDSRLSAYLRRFKTTAGILVARPLR
jgi:hypothetical protein